MFKVEKIKTFLDCDQCSNLLVEPITLACGFSVCKKHIDKLIKEPSTNPNQLFNFFKCELCNEDHFIPPNGFVINKRMQSGLEIEFNTLKLNPIYDECKKEIEQAKENIINIDSLESSAECYIYDYFQEIIRQVDLRREDLKAKIDKYSDDSIQLVQETKSNYMKASKDLNLNPLNFEKSKQKLNDLVKQFDTLEFDDKKFKTIRKSVADFNMNFKYSISHFHRQLIQNTEYSFVFKEMPIADIFGNLMMDKKVKQDTYLFFNDCNLIFIF